MARCYSGIVPNRQPPLPCLWLVTDARTDPWLDGALLRLPRGSGVIFRHYHLPPPERRRQLARLRRAAERRGHVVVLAGSASEARRARVDGSYGASPGRRCGGLRLITAHSRREMAAALRAGADAVLLSPVFPTRSHPGAAVLGAVRWRLMAGHCPVPMIALGGVNAHRARAFGLARWAAIDGLGHSPTARFPVCS